LNTLGHGASGPIVDKKIKFENFEGEIKIMKKLTVLLMICSLFVITTMVFADDSNDGINWSSVVGDQYVNDNTINHDSYTADTDKMNGQEASVKIAAKAYIPCYLSMEFIGNEGRTYVESFGPDAKANVKPTDYLMVFDNELGGFVDSDWKLKAAGKNAEVAPGTGYYIAACDTFKVIVYSNDIYKYEVESAPLVNAGGKTLNLDMGTSDSINGTYSLTTFDASKTEIIADNVPACTELTKFHKFRVPYAKNIVQGEYNGDVTFRAVTL
jgi:hypothetical protein